jgi:hypothetical protein
VKHFAVCKKGCKYKKRGLQCQNAKSGDFSNSARQTPGVERFEFKERIFGGALQDSRALNPTLT